MSQQMSRKGSKGKEWNVLLEFIATFYVPSVNCISSGRKDTIIRGFEYFQTPIRVDLPAGYALTQVVQ